MGVSAISPGAVRSGDRGHSPRGPVGMTWFLVLVLVLVLSLLARVELESLEGMFDGGDVLGAG